MFWLRNKNFNFQIHSYLEACKEAKRFENVICFRWYFIGNQNFKKMKISNNLLTRTSRQITHYKEVSYKGVLAIRRIFSLVDMIAKPKF